MLPKIIFIWLIAISQQILRHSSDVPSHNKCQWERHIHVPVVDWWTNPRWHTLCAEGHWDWSVHTDTPGHGQLHFLPTAAAVTRRVQRQGVLYLEGWNGDSGTLVPHKVCSSCDLQQSVGGFLANKQPTIGYIIHPLPAINHKEWRAVMGI